MTTIITAIVSFVVGAWFGMVLTAALIANRE